MGLSPLARGSRPAFRHSALSPGPIPARAGEPPEIRQTGTDTRAYPRSRGGTFARVFHVTHQQGLSPLARGNLTTVKVLPSPIRPIPARAGEPIALCVLVVRSWAYPRSRGGTSAA